MRHWEAGEDDHQENMAKAILQWGALPIIGLLMGIVGTYTSEYSSVKHQVDVNSVVIEQLKHNDDTFKQELADSRRDFTDRVLALANLQEKTIELSKDLIALVKLQQQSKMP